MLRKDFHKHVLDWDQEHAMFLCEGTLSGLFYAIMNKPLNVKPVYRLGTVEPGQAELQIAASQTFLHFVGLAFGIGGGLANLLLGLRASRAARMAPALCSSPRFAASSGSSPPWA